MESKAVFTQERHKEAFKGLCINVPPPIGEIIESARKSGVEGMIGISVATDGYFSFDVHNSSWKMARLDNDSPVKIKYEHSEEIQVSEEPQAMAIFNHTTENVIEIAQVFSCKSQERPELLDIESSEWKLKFVEWANEFEAGWKEDGIRDYIEDVTEYASVKIDEYYKEVQGDENI